METQGRRAIIRELAEVLAVDVLEVLAVRAVEVEVQLDLVGAVADDDSAGLLVDPGTVGAGRGGAGRVAIG